VSKILMCLFSLMLAYMPVAQAEPTKCVVVKGALCCWNPEEDGYFIPFSCL